jgi:hypothetical protein
MLSKVVFAYGDECAQTRLLQKEGSPHQHGNVYREERIAEERRANPHLTDDCATKISREQDGAKDRSERHGVKRSADEQDDADRYSKIFREAKPRHCLSDRQWVNELHDAIEKEKKDGEDAKDTASPEPRPGWRCAIDGGLHVRFLSYKSEW